MQHKYKSVVGTKGIEEKSIPGGLDTVRSCAPTSQMQGAGQPVVGARLWVGAGHWRVRSRVWWRSGAGGLAHGLWAVGYDG